MRAQIHIQLLRVQSSVCKIRDNDVATQSPAFHLALVLIHIVGIQVTGVSVNPARSFGPAIIVGGTAVSQLWLFIVAPLIGAGLAGLFFRQKLLETE